MTTRYAQTRGEPGLALDYSKGVERSQLRELTGWGDNGLSDEARFPLAAENRDDR